MNYIKMIDKSLAKLAKLAGRDKSTAIKQGLLDEKILPTYVAMSFYNELVNTHKHYACPMVEVRRIFIKTYNEFRAASTVREGYAEIQFDLCVKAHNYITNVLYA